MKDLMPSAWEGFVATHRPGDVVRGKVSRFTNFGIFVELGEGLEGLCHISELSDERVERAEQVAELGQEMDFKILRIEHEDQKIGLSHRAVGKEDERVVDTKMYSTEAKGGMASLAELANLKFGRAAEEPAVEKKEKPQKAEEKPAEETVAPEEAPAPREEPAAAETSEEASKSDEANAPAEEASTELVAETTAEPVEDAAAEPATAETNTETSEPQNEESEERAA
jgi:small subunit ribosomal protein S1